MKTLLLPFVKLAIWIRLREAMRFPMCKFPPLRELTLKEYWAYHVFLERRAHWYDEESKDALKDEDGWNIAIFIEAVNPPLRYYRMKSPSTKAMHDEIQAFRKENAN